MAHGQLSTVIGYLRRIVRPPADGADSDRQLLQRFAAQQDQDAFAELVRRHGPMVLNVCRRLLNDDHAAEDAFQAVFLVLARKARSLSWQESVAGWLHEVARRTAIKARMLMTRRRELERQASDMTSADRLAETDWRELRAVLDEELGRLPEKYRAPLVLCYLEGRTNEEAARQLGWTKGTVSGRLARARDLLRGRLDRRGLALSAAALATALEQRTAEAALSSALCDSTIQAAVRFAAGNLATAGSGPAVMLAEGVLTTMALSRWKLVSLLLLVLLVAGGGAGALTYHTLNGATPAPIPGSEPVSNLEQKQKEVAQPYASVPVRVNGADFQAVTDPIWPVPEAGKQSQIALALHITNRGKETLRFKQYRGSVVLKRADGTALTPIRGSGLQRRRFWAQIALEPGKVLVAAEPAHLFDRGTSLVLGWLDDTDTSWTFEGLQPGKYLVSLRYSFPQAGPGEWAGVAETAPLAVEIKKVAAAGDFGAEVQGLRARVTLPRAQFKVGEPIEVRYAIKNVSKQDKVVQKISGYWPYDMIQVMDAAGKKVPLTPQAQAALTALSPPRGPFAPPPGKNLLGHITLKPGEETSTKGQYDLTKVYDLSNPGRYQVQYIYRVGGLGEGEVPSNELPFEIVAK